mmetsp:Transcript_31445/g.50935  ORF Transcript_31445/g.50935 Transcript_31445/m.50935 type:complete len:245 (-) Transcript_31445:114-848(-)
MEVEKFEPTQIVKRQREPRTLQILPPSFNDAVDSNGQAAVELLDGLPYIEHFSEMQLANAEKAVMDELAVMEKKSDIPDDSTTECPMISSQSFQDEIDRIHRKESVLNFDRYACQEPRTEQQHLISVWKQQIECARVQWLYQFNALMECELMSKYNAEKWRNYNDYLADINKYYEQQHQKMQHVIDEINRERKTAQNKAKVELDALESEFWDLVKMNNEIELQTQILKSQMDGLNQLKNIDKVN